MKSPLKTVAVILLMVVIAVGCTKPDVPNNGGNDNGYVATVVPHNGGGNDSIAHGFVDLGLPSGILWATCNVGASCPEDCGDYFAWGETLPKDIYDWKSYKYSEFDGVDYRLTKYCIDSFCGLNGFVDSLTVLEPMDDAVRANWGENWRLPSEGEWRELLQNTTFVLTVQNNVQGWLFTSENGNNLFLPTTGFVLYDELICTTLGIYWSSSLQTTSQVSAWSFHSDLEECHVCATYERSRGQVVRAVRSAE